MLYDPAQFEPLTDEPWDSARAEDAIAAIIADADAAFDHEALWPAHEWDGEGAPLPLKSLYVGAAGVIWALDALRRGGHAETSLDLRAAALCTLELERAEPEFKGSDPHWQRGALLTGETGPVLVALRVGADAALADDLHALVRENIANPTDDVMWGAPGTLLAAAAMNSLTGEPRWAEAARETAAALRQRRAGLASGRARRREGPRHLPRHLGERLRAPEGLCAHRRPALARACAPLRGPRARPGRAPSRGERPWPVLALDGRRRHCSLRRGLPRRRRALSDSRRRLARLRVLLRPPD